MLLRDATGDIRGQAGQLRHWMEACGRIAAEHGESQLAMDRVAFSEAVKAEASAKAEFVVALARSKMLDDFGEPDAADAVIKPYFLAGLETSKVEENTT